jgi:hypothetical protein
MPREPPVYELRVVRLFRSVTFIVPAQVITTSGVQGRRHNCAVLSPPSQALLALGEIELAEGLPI